MSWPSPCCGRRIALFSGGGRCRSQTPTRAEVWWVDAPPEPAGAAVGLTSDEAKSRRAAFGPNLFSDHQERSLAMQFLSRFRNPLVILLLVASAISAFTGEITNFFIISAMVLFSVTLDFFQEHSAGKAAATLRRIRVGAGDGVRDGKPTSMPVAELVPGDLALLAAGDMVPADGLLIEARDLFVKQALLTGRPIPSRSAPAPCRRTPPISRMPATPCSWNERDQRQRPNAVTRTGGATAIGAIAASVNRQPPPTAFEVGTHRFGMLIMRLTVLLVLFVLMVNMLMHKPWLESFCSLSRSPWG